jgi:hypothetical protein
MRDDVDDKVSREADISLERIARPDDEDVAAALLAHLRAADDEQERYFWAWERVENGIDHGRPRDAWAVILAAVDQAETDRDLRFIGAGVLESLISSHADEMLGELLTQMRTSPKLARAAASMYVYDLKPDQVDAVARAVAEMKSSG